MSSYGFLRVGSLIVSELRNGVENELMAVFRDDMLHITRCTASQYYTLEKGYDEDYRDDDYEMDVTEFRAPSEVIASRLDIMGIDEAGTLAYLNEKIRINKFSEDELMPPHLREQIINMLPADRGAGAESTWALQDSLSAQVWLEMLASAPEEPLHTSNPRLGGSSWLFDCLEDGWNDLYVLRAVLLAFPHAEVVLDVTSLVVGGYLNEADLEHLASEAAAAARITPQMHAPVVVLTEGRTDAEFLRAALAISYPHLTDLIRFLDYERKLEGGAGALVRMVRAFASAGIANRVVAVFDNDTAAADALRVINSATLPNRIQVIHYPALDIAKKYPTLGPPTINHPEGSVSLSDVNGLACSIELYLGKDVLVRQDGTLYPVQWKSFIPGRNRYQGEIVDKESIHDAFRTKYAIALQDKDQVKDQDWDGLSLIIDAICTAAQSASGIAAES